ncbi:helix-turn-helix domain-containing protein [Nitrospinae bacterium AH-259-F20]|nr:helix-turn-helix domain-containing protein [Nitrospinae bacterium AH-259-F20]
MILTVDSSSVNPKLLDVKTAAQYLGISPWTIREMQWRGDLPYVKFNRKIYFARKDLDAFIELHKFRESP